MRYAIHARVSSGGQARSEYSSVGTQREIREHCVQVQRKESWRVIEVYEDSALSSSGLGRSAIQCLLPNARQGKCPGPLACRPCGWYPWPQQPLADTKDTHRRCPVCHEQEHSKLQLHPHVARSRPDWLGQLQAAQIPTPNTRRERRPSARLTGTGA